MKPKKVLYLHIGMPKTGTSSLQLFLVQNQEALAKQGFAYPMMPGRYFAVSPNRNAHFLAGKIKDAQGHEDLDQTEQIKKQSFELLDRTFWNTDNVILSDEAIWNTYKSDDPECLRSIRTFCEERDIALKLIVYLRRQDYYLESYWKQQILKRGVNWSWERMIKKTPKYIVLDYYKHLEVLAKEVGRENIMVQLYYEECFDLCSDFLRVAGIKLTDEFEPLQEKINLSLNNNYAQIKRILNGVCSEDPVKWNMDHKWLKRMVINGSRLDKEQYESTMFSEEERRKFLKRFEEVNHKIAREYMGRDELFDDSMEQSQSLPKWEPDNPLQYEDTVTFLGMALLELKREQEMQRAQLKQLASGQRNIFRKVIDKCRSVI